MKLPDDGSAATARVRFTVSEPGPRVLRFRVAPQAGELITENNAREVANRRARSQGKDSLLRRRTATRDEVPQARRHRRSRICSSSALQRTADNKYLRIGVDDDDELAGGVPEDARRVVRLSRR